MSRRLVTPEESAVTASRLKLAIMQGASSGDYVELPTLGRAWCQLAGSRASQDVDVAALTSLAESLGDKTAGTFLGNLLEMERAMRILPLVMRDPDDHSKPFGTHEEWESISGDLLNACWFVYSDVREKLDPVTQPMTKADRAMIVAALEKKSPMLLRSFGTAKLVDFMLSMAEQPSTSLTQSAGSSDTSPDS